MRLATGNHVNLTVTDLEHSVRWYGRVFGLVEMADETIVTPATESAIRYRSLFDPATMSYVVGLIEHPDGDSSRFDERRTGLDHFALHVPDPQDLEDWAHHLDELGIEHSGVKHAPYEDAITLRDPDNIQLEICWPNTAWWAKHLGSA
jgi:glyoxylase I family protein